MNCEVYSTNDLWLGSLFLTETDAELIDVSFAQNGRNTVTFSFEGENLSKLAKDYSKQVAIANVSHLRKKLNHLRDLIFQHKSRN